MNTHSDSFEPGPEANALKHGFCATKIVDPAVRARANVLRDELVQIHDPWSPDESDAVDELAQVLARLERLETAMDAKASGEKAQAAELYDKRAQASLEADLARLHENPTLHAATLGLTWHGATHLELLWSRLLADLKPEPDIADDETTAPCLPFHLACEAASALGGFWHVDRTDGAAAWLMARWVRIAPDPEESLEVWIRHSKALDGPKATLARAKKLLAQAPLDPARAVAEIVEKATVEMNRWALQAKMLRPNYETARAGAADLAVGTGAGDPALEKDFRLLSRYLTGTRNRADRLRRRLDGLKKSRKSFARRAQQAAEREARRLKKESESALRRYEAEVTGISPASASYASAYPAYEASEYNSRKQEYSDHAINGDPRIQSAPSTPSNASGESTQITSEQDDTIELRNGFHAGFGAAEETGADMLDDFVVAAERPDARAEAARAKLAGVSREAGTFRDRMKMIRYRDWSDSRDVMDDESDILRQLMALPESFERTFTIQALFGSAKTFRRCWRAYKTWADPQLVAAAEQAYQASVK